MGIDSADGMIDFLDPWPVLDLLKGEGIMYLLMTIFMLFFAKVSYGMLSSFNLNEQLTKVDNKAVALSFAGYILGFGLILQGIASSPSAHSGTMHPFLQDALATLFWGVLGIALLALSRLINDKLLFANFSNTKELVTDRNIGTGAIEFGSFIGSALIIAAAQSGEGNNLLHSVATTLLFYFAGQLFFWGYALVYQKMTKYNVKAEIEKDNIAAGVSFALNMIAISWLISGFIKHSDSLVGLFIWAVFSTFLLISCRYLVDKLILPGDLLDEEVSRDQNWGASIIEGGAAIVISIIAVSTFF